MAGWTGIDAAGEGTGVRQEVDRRALDRVVARLVAAGVPTPDVDAGWLVAEAMHAGSLDEAALEQLVARRERRVPLQVVLGSVTFRWVTLATRSGVFVPRPETEVVAGVAIDEALGVATRPTVVDACTGAGSIALAVASEVPGVTVVATEVDRRAVALAQQNLAALAARRDVHGHVASPFRPGDRLAPGAAVQVLHGDLLDPVSETLRGSVDVLVANPPYLPSADRGTWEPEVADHDPERALVGGPDGHEVVEHLMVRAATWLRPGGMVAVEIDDRRGADAVRMARLSGLVDVRIVRDLAGRDRAVVARRGDGHRTAGRR